MKIDRQMELGDRQSLSKNQQIDDLNRQILEKSP
jgi:hypothetical protein